MAGIFIRHIGCAECGSSDNMAVYQADDNTFNASCFGCQHYMKNIDEFGNTIKEGETMPEREEFELEAKIDLSTIENLPTKKNGIPERLLHGNVTRYYGLRLARMGTDSSVTHHFYPYHSQDGELVGYQKRDVKNKKFSAVGYGKSDIMLQGAENWKNGGQKHLVITEGFLDMLSVSQVLSGSEDKAVRYPVVSLPAGGNIKCIIHNLKWINSFDRVVLMLDQDKVGKEAAEEIAKLLDPGKTCIAKLSEKDPSDMLVQGKDKELEQAFWQAQVYSPAGIISGAELINAINTRHDEPCFDLPDFLGTLNDMMYGVRLGEITLLTSGTGSGKTQVAREMNYDLLMNTEDKVGIVSLEEAPADVGLGLLSLHMNKRVHLPDTKVDEEEKQKAMEDLFNSNQLFVLDHQGSSADDDLIGQVKHLIAMGCKWVTIDHITVATSGAANVNQAIDNFMDQLLKLALKFHVHFTVISHLRKVGQGQKAFEEGAVPSLDDLKGSGSIKQIAHNVIAFSRNRMDEDPIKKNTTKIYLLKARIAGKSGYAGQFHFDDVSGRLNETFDHSQDTQTDELPIAKKTEEVIYFDAKENNPRDKANQ